MKYTSIIALALIAATSLVSCKKDEKACYTCTATITTDMGTPATSSSQEFCDKTQSEMDDYEKAGSTTMTTAGVKMTTVMDCNKK